MALKFTPLTNGWCKKRKLFACAGWDGYVAPMKYVGVDGCRGGWFAVCLEEEQSTFGVFRSFSSLWEVLGNARLVLVDIPIGLPGKTVPVRQADTHARRLLPGRASSVFTPGAREVLEATDYAEACEVNRKVTGKKINKQCWNIMSKIGEADAFLRENPKALATIREAHPEVCFAAAKGGVLATPKRRPEGIRERLAILKSFVSNASEVYETALQDYYRKTVARDDILDAMMLAVTARDSQGDMVPLPDPPERDEAGLPMAVWYHDFSRSREEL